VRIPYLYDESDHPDMQDDVNDPLGMMAGGGGGMGNPNSQINPYKVYTLDEAVRLLQQALRDQGYTAVSPTALRGPPLSPFSVETTTAAAATSLDKDSIDPTSLSSSSSLLGVASTTDSDQNGNGSTRATPTGAVGVLVRTRDWILAQAKQAKDHDGNVQLANTLLMTIGAVSHMSHCLYQSEIEATMERTPLHASDTATDEALAERQQHEVNHHSHDHHGHCQ
jgi:hypothetical protein